MALDQSYINVTTKPIWFWVTSVTQYMLLDPYCIIPVIMQFQYIGLDCTFITFVITVLYIAWNLQCFSFSPSCILKHLCFPLIKKSLPFLWISWKFYLRCSWSFLKEIVLIKKNKQTHWIALTHCHEKNTHFISIPWRGSLPITIWLSFPVLFLWCVADSSFQNIGDSCINTVCLTLNKENMPCI